MYSKHTREDFFFGVEKHPTLTGVTKNDPLGNKRVIS